MTRWYGNIACAGCGLVGYRRISMRYCSLKCSVFSRTKTVGDCWLWQGAKLPDGYGHLRFDGRQMRAHRAAYETAFGKLPSEMLVCHSCDQPACCNPQHLFAGTNKDNSDDKLRKGRQRRGEANHAKLTEDQIREIRASNESMREMAKRFGVSVSHLSKIRRKVKWAHV
jgi:hypothetical protein